MLHSARMECILRYWEPFVGLELTTQLKHLIVRVILWVRSRMQWLFIVFCWMIVVTIPLTPRMGQALNWIVSDIIRQKEKIIKDHASQLSLPNPLIFNSYLSFYLQVVIAEEIIDTSSLKFVITLARPTFMFNTDAIVALYAGGLLFPFPAMKTWCYFLLFDLFLLTFAQSTSIVAGNTKFSENLQTYLLSRDYHSLKSEFQANNGKVWNPFFCSFKMILCRFRGTGFNSSLFTPLCLQINVSCVIDQPQVELCLGKHVFLTVGDYLSRSNSPWVCSFLLSVCILNQVWL